MAFCFFQMLHKLRHVLLNKINPWCFLKSNVSIVCLIEQIIYSTKPDSCQFLVFIEPKFFQHFFFDERLIKSCFIIVELSSKCSNLCLALHRTLQHQILKTKQ